MCCVGCIAWAVLAVGRRSVVSCGCPLNCNMTHAAGRCMQIIPGMKEKFSGVSSPGCLGCVNNCMGCRDPRLTHGNGLTWLKQTQPGKILMHIAHIVGEIKYFYLFIFIYNAALRVAASAVRLVVFWRYRVRLLAASLLIYGANLHSAISAYGVLSCKK